MERLMKYEEENILKAFYQVYSLCSLGCLSMIIFSRIIPYRNNKFDLEEINNM